VYIQGKDFVESEYYQKQWKVNLVYCTKNYKDMHFDKVQTFEKEEPWLLH